MNKTKRAFQLTCAITSIVYGSLMLLGCIMLFSCLPMIIEMMNSAAGSTGTPAVDEAMMATLYTAIMINGIFSIPIIVVGACACPDRSKRVSTPSENTGLMITLLVLHALLLIASLASLSVVCIIVSAVCVGFAIATLCIRKSATPATQPVTANVNANEGVEISIIHQSQQTSATDTKIAKIRALRDQGVFTPEEAKNLIIKELQK